MRCRQAQRKANNNAQNAKTKVTNVAQLLGFAPDAEQVVSRSATKSTLNPPSHSVVRPNLVLGWRVRRAQGKASEKAHNAKTKVTNAVQLLSLDPDAEPVIQSSPIKRALNAPNESVMRPSLVLGRRIRITRVRRAPNLGSLIMGVNESFHRKPLYHSPLVFGPYRMSFHLTGYCGAYLKCLYNSYKRELNRQSALASLVRLTR